MSIPKPVAESVRPAAITKAGRTRRATSGASKEPATSPPADGNVQRPSLKRRELEHELEVLGDEGEGAGYHEDAEQERAMRGAERRFLKEPEVDQRVVQLALYAVERG